MKASTVACTSWRSIPVLSEMRLTRSAFVIFLSVTLLML